MQIYTPVEKFYIAVSEVCLCHPSLCSPLALCLLLALPSICAKFVTSSRVILLSSFSPLIYLLLYQVWQHQLDEKARATTQAKLSDADITEVDGKQVFQEAERKVASCPPNAVCCLLYGVSFVIMFVGSVRRDWAQEPEFDLQ